MLGSRPAVTEGGGGIMSQEAACMARLEALRMQAIRGYALLREGDSDAFSLTDADVRALLTAIETNAIVDPMAPKPIKVFSSNVPAVLAELATLEAAKVVAHSAEAAALTARVQMLLPFYHAPPRAPRDAMLDAYLPALQLLSEAAIEKLVRPSALRVADSSFVVEQLRAAGKTVPELLEAGFTANELDAGGYKNAGAKARAAGFGSNELLDAGFSADELVDAGFFARKTNAAWLGLDNAGKTSLLRLLKNDRMVQSTPTLRATAVPFVFEDVCVTAFDFGGHEAARKEWVTCFSRSYEDEDGLSIVFMVDASDRDRFPEVKKELDTLLSMDTLAKSPFLILCNKVDVGGAAQEKELRTALGLREAGKFSMPPYQSLPKGSATTRPVELFMCSVLKRVGYQDGLRWLCHHVKSIWG